MPNKEAGQPIRFLCDEMLGKLGRWLRAAGYDTLIAESGSGDTSVLALAVAERRILLTRDRELLERAAGRIEAVGLAAAGTDAAALQLREAAGVDWLHAPFTRCVVDNTPLRATSAAERERIPERARAVGDAVNICPGCQRLYWPGSHVRRMTARLARWQAGLSGVESP